MSQEKDSFPESKTETLKRKVAKKLFINDILSATYIKRPGWEPSGILTSYGEISRVHLLGLIVSIPDNNGSFLLDDGTGSIEIRFFEQHKNSFILGDMVEIIGKPREFNPSKYIVPEILKKITDKKWFDVHQLEIALQKKNNIIKLPVEPVEDEKIETGPYQKILNSIAILDKGDGVDIEDIVKHLKIDNSEEIIKSLIEEGEVFEISPGRVKLLD